MANALGKPGGVRTTHADYDKRLPQWKRCRDAVAGQDAVHTAGELYLPKLRDQRPEDYAAYKQRAPWYNASARTIDGLNGMLFRKPPTKAVPTGLDPLLLDIDMCGTPFDMFAEEISEENLEVGRVGLLVDYAPAPIIEGPITVAKAQKVGLRPTIQKYKAEAIINWRFRQVNNQWTLVQVVLAEEYTEPKTNIDGTKSEFENVTEDRFRVLDLDEANTYRMRVFRINNRNEDELVSEIWPLKAGQKLNFIPFTVIGVDGVGFEVEEPPLIDLVDINFSHYRTAADYEHGCHFTALPTLYVSGYSSPVPDEGEAPEKIYLGSEAAIVLSDPQAKAGFVEFTGTGLGAIEKNLDRKEQQMAILGARMIAAEKKQAETATTTAIHRTGENSILASISISTSLGLTKALKEFADWAGSPSDAIDYKLNRDFFPLGVDAPTLLAWMQMWQAGSINDEEYFDILQRADAIEADVTFEDHKAGNFTVLAPPTAAAPPKPSDPAPAA